MLSKNVANEHAQAGPTEQACCHIAARDNGDIARLSKLCAKQYDTPASSLTFKGQDASTRPGCSSGHTLLAAGLAYLLRHRMQQQSDDTGLVPDASEHMTLRC